MKTEEDEAFDELARKQGNWGGGYQAKRQMAADKFIAAEERKVGERYGYVPKLHPSEWMNAQPAQEPVAWNKQIRDSVDSLLEQAGYQPDSSARNALSMMNFDAQPLPVQPAQEPVAHLWECLGRWSAYLVENGKQADCAPPSWLVDAINKATTSPLPVQEPESLGEFREWLCKELPPETEIENPDWWAERIYKRFTIPPKREWVGLTPEDILVLFDEHNLYGSKLVEFTRAVETKIKEKNND